MLQVLELGAGCGLLGMLVARNLPHAAEVCLTEQAYGGALEHLCRNVEANRHLPNMLSVTTCSCDWTHFMNDKLVQQVRAGAHQSPPAVAERPDNAVQLKEQQQQEQQHGQQQEQQLCKPTGVQLGFVAAGNTAAAAELHEVPEVLSPAELADMQKLLSTPWDVIIGSDLVYNKAGVKGLPRVLAALMKQCAPASSTIRCCGCSRAAGQLPSSRCSCSKVVTTAAAALDTSCSSSSCSLQHQQHRPVFYYAHTKHRFDAYDVELFAELEDLGLTVEEVIEDGEELPPPSPPPFSSLYPDMRCAVFKISRTADTVQ